MMINAPFSIPELPAPATIRPPISVPEVLARAQIKEPTSKTKKNPRNVHYDGVLSDGVKEEDC